ncbi:MAG: CDP-glycerol glycerophosphotransferase family protein [Clostridiales Family XIII bacterium]|nr:CDP-glycerol glycerophosphotransferase family protein [Clostridiales Family XIII bacterium]
MDKRELQFQKSWYIESLRDELIPAIESGAESDPVGALFSRFARNAGDAGRDVLDEGGFAEFIGLVSKAVSLLPGAAPIRAARVPEHFKRFLLRIGGHADGTDQGRRAPAVNIRSIMPLRGRLLIEGYSDTERIGDIERALPADGADEPEQDAQQAKAMAMEPAETAMHVGEREIPLPDAGHYAEIKYFGRTLVSFRTFEADIDIASLVEGDEIYFVRKDGGDAGAPGVGDGSVDSGNGVDGEDGDAAARTEDPSRLRIVFAAPQAGISPGLGCLYKDYGTFALEYDPVSSSIKVCMPSVSLRLKNERRALRSLARAKIPFTKKLFELVLRAACFITRPYFRRLKMRLYYDRIYMGGDNGQYLFEYSSDRCRAEGGPVGRHRYIASNLSGAYFTLKRDEYKIHASESPYRKLLAVQADVVFATHHDAMGFLGLDSFEKRWLADLFSAHVVCIQHGLAMRSAPGSRARYIDNTEMYFCASEKEADNLRLGVYGYSPEMVKVTGLPRFDGRVSYPEGIVLLAPTWHGSCAAGSSRAWVPGEYSPEFKDTAYFGVYRDLITNEQVLSLLEDSGYRLVLLLHPGISAQAPDFEGYAGGPVEVAASTVKGYGQYLNQADVLITDYSDVQYDFAYMSKPIIYYHPGELSPTYDSGAFDCGTIGFGTVTKDVAELVACLSELVETDTDAGSDGAYAARARDFFTYHDRENRGRIYDEIEREYG